MYRKFAAAVVVVCVALGVAIADEFNATLNKVDGSKITYTKKAKKGEEAKEATMDAATDVKVYKGKALGKGKYEKGDELKGGLKADELTAAVGKKGATVRITTDDAKKVITQIWVLEGKK